MIVCLSTASVLGIPVPLFAYILLFGAAAVACFAAIQRAERIDDDGIRRGLVGLLICSGTWAGAHVVRLAVPTQSLKVVFYLIGLTVGLGSVFAWLYFCSAYTGRQYHRTPVYRRLALTAFVVITVFKLTTTVHGWYFTTVFETTPYPHLEIQLSPAHWVVTGFAYALSTVGFYMLLEMFTEIEYDTTVLGFLFLLTGLPVALDLIGYLGNDIILPLNYEPLGVAVFAVGVLYVTETTFLAVPRIGRQQLIDALDEIILFLDDDGRVVDCNDTASQHVPDIKDGFGEPLEATLPALSDFKASDGEVITVQAAESEPRHYLVEVTRLTTGKKTLGKAVVLTDVTTVEQHRQELRRQNDLLDGFSAATAHELRNALGIFGGQLDLLADRIRASDSADALDTVDTLSQTADRMDAVVTDLITLARLSQSVSDPPIREFITVVEDAWAQCNGATDRVSLQIRGSGRLRVDERRLVEILDNLGEITASRGGETLAVRLDGRALTIRLDGGAINADPEEVFQYGTAVPDSETGRLFANVQALARAHGWDIIHSPTGEETIELQCTGICIE
jgi:signal transduction histidine kinase